MVQIFGFALIALVLSYAMVVVIRHWGERRQIVSIPNERSAHTRPMPIGGGLAISGLTIAGIVLWHLLTEGAISLAVVAYITGGAGIAAVSWIDDLGLVPYQVRLIVHSAAALLVMALIGTWDTSSVPLLSRVGLGWVGWPLTFLWIVGLINAFNFLDGIDGIAGSTAVVAGVAWGVLGYISMQPAVMVLGCLLAATSLGFLGQNWAPARIFMGDVGATFLGFSFAVLPLFVARTSVDLFLAGPLVLWPCIFDTLFVVLARFHRGESVFVGHRGFLFHRLVIAGHSHCYVSILYTGLALIGAAFAIGWAVEMAGIIYTVSFFLPLLCLCLWAYVAYHERRHSMFSHPTLVALEQDYASHEVG